MQMFNAQIFSLLRPEVLFGDNAPSLNSSDSEIFSYIFSKYPTLLKNINTLESRMAEPRFTKSEASVYDLLREHYGHPAMMQKSLYVTYQHAVSTKFQSGFYRHIKRRLIRAALLQERSPDGLKALKEGSLQNKYLKQVLLSRYDEFFQHIDSFHRALTDMEVRNVSDNQKPYLDFLLLRPILKEDINMNMSRQATVKLLMYDYYYSLSVHRLKRNAGDFFFFLTRKHAKSLKDYLFSGLSEKTNLISIHLLSKK